MCPAQYHAIIAIHCLMLLTRLKIWADDDAGRYACGQWYQHLDSAAANNNMPDEYRVEINNCLEVFLKSHGLEVWINTVIRNFKSGETARLLKAVEVKLQVFFCYFLFSNA